MFVTPGPSGLNGRLRKATVAERMKLTEAAARGGRDGNFWPTVSSLWEETIATGPYPHVRLGEGRVDLRRVLLGDALHALVMTRVIAVSRYAEIPYKCPQANCGEANVLEIDLLEDITIRPLPEEAARVIREEGGLFRTTIRGAKVTFKLMTPELEATIAPAREAIEKERRRNRGDPIPKRGDPDLYAAQTTYIQELGEEKSRDQRARLEWFWSIDTLDELAFGEEIAKYDCGYVDRIPHVCAGCFEENHVLLPLDREFFKPTRIPPREMEARKKAEEEATKTTGTTSERTSSPPGTGTPEGSTSSAA
jgi:hypothetical protein